MLHLKSISAGIDVLSFDFLDPPEQASLVDALRQARDSQKGRKRVPIPRIIPAPPKPPPPAPAPPQLHALDAIDADGAVTPLGRRMAHLPVDPGLARALLAADQTDCYQEVASIAAMLSCERLYQQQGGPAGRGDGPDGPPPDIVPAAEAALGDHIQARGRGGRERWGRGAAPRGAHKVSNLRGSAPDPHLADAALVSGLGRAARPPRQGGVLRQGAAAAAVARVCG